MRHVLLTDIEMNTADVIKGLRAEKGLTLRQLAANAKVSKSGLSRWEHGERVPNVDVFIRILNALDSDIVVVKKPRRDDGATPASAEV